MCDEYGYCLIVHIITCNHKTFVFNIKTKENKKFSAVTYDLRSMNQTFASQRFQLRCGILYRFFAFTEYSLGNYGQKYLSSVPYSVCFSGRFVVVSLSFDQENDFPEDRSYNL